MGIYLNFPLALLTSLHYIAKGVAMAFNRARASLVLLVFSLSLGGCNIPPTAKFVANPSQGPAPLAVAFDASSSFDPDGEIVSYSWNFGDGATGSGVTITHTYDSPGTYTARLTVTDDRGATDSATRTIHVTEPGVTASNGYVSITLRGVRSATSIGIWEPDPGRFFLIVDVKVVALRDDQYVSKFDFKIIQSDGRVQNAYATATYSLPHPFEDAELDAGQWTDGEIAFEVYPAEHYILEWEGWFGEPIQFPFSL